MSSALTGLLKGLRACRACLGPLPFSGFRFSEPAGFRTGAAVGSLPEGVAFSAMPGDGEDMVCALGMETAGGCWTFCMRLGRLAG